jgi:hypothetical protein
MPSRKDKEKPKPTQPSPAWIPFGGLIGRAQEALKRMEEERRKRIKQAEGG